MTSTTLRVTVWVSIIAIFIAYRIRKHLGNSAAITPESHPYIVINDFITDEHASQLRTHFEQLIFPQARADFSAARYTDIGEAYDPNSDNECSKSGTILNPVINKCIFIPRLDAIRNYQLSGGYEGYKENGDKLRSRTALFIKHQFNAYNKPEYKTLFESVQFRDAIHSVCPQNYSYIKPIELNLGLQLPGQGLLAHRDVVYFKHATRQTHPLWLLSVMKESKLFTEKNIPQIQGVLYMGKNNKDGGDIYMYPNGLGSDVRLVPPTMKSVVIMDGTEIIHGTTVYDKDIEPLSLLQNRNKIFELRFDESVEKWRVYTGMNATSTEYVYGWGEIRASMAYRALCFDDENEMNAWNEPRMESDLIGIDEILMRLKVDLMQRNRVTVEKWDSMEKYELGKFLLDEYIKLPQSEIAWITLNYAAVYEYYCNNHRLYDGVLHRILGKLLNCD